MLGVDLLPRKVEAINNLPGEAINKVLSNVTVDGRPHNAFKVILYLAANRVRTCDVKEYLDSLSYLCMRMPVLIDRSIDRSAPAAANRSNQTHNQFNPR